MAEYDPTAANIVASLGIKGATEGGATADGRFAGYVPVIGKNGKLNASLIDADAISLAVSPVSSIVYVDAGTSAPVEFRTGSITAPFASLPEAAGKFAAFDDSDSDRYVAFVLAPGRYSGMMKFESPRMPRKVAIVGVGRCEIADGFSVSGFASMQGETPVVLFKDIVCEDGTIGIASQSSIYVVGKSEIGKINSEGSELKISSEAIVGSTTAKLSYLSKDSRIANSSSVPGATACDAFNRLWKRVVRVGDVSYDKENSKFTIGEVSKDITGEDDVFDLAERDKVFVEGINALFDRGRSITAGTLTVEGSLTASVAEINELKIRHLALGGYKLSVDLYGYLVILDGDESSYSPSDIRFLRDSDSNEYYVLGVADGRLYIERADQESEGPHESCDSIHLVDEDGTKYELFVKDGRVTIKKV